MAVYCPSIIRGDVLMKKISKCLVVLITAFLFVSPITASASTSLTNNNSGQQEEIITNTNYAEHDAEVSPNAIPPVLQ